MKILKVVKKAAALLFCGVLIAAQTFALPVYAVDTQSGGYWEFVGASVDGDGQHWLDGWNKNEYEYTVTAKPGEYTYTWVCHVDYYSASGDLLNLKGDNSTVVCTNSAPPEIIHGGDTVSIDVTLRGHYEERYKGDPKNPSDYADQGYMDICAIYEHGGYNWFTFGDNDDSLYTSKEEPTASRVFKCEIRSGSREGDTLDIRPRSVSGTICHYTYEWHPEITFPAAGNTVSDTEEESSSESESSSDENDDLNIVVDNSADESVGEDGGEDIDEEIVEGKQKKKGKGGAIAGAGLIGAAAGAAAADNKKKKKKKSRYRMHVYKDYGDTLRKNQQPVPIFARIVEVNESGIETDCPELSSKISIFAGNNAVNVWDRGVSGVWKAAEIQAKDTDETEAIVCFRFEGEGGSFTNRVHFRLETPRIRFSQKNIALPACYPEEEPIEFVVEGMADPEKTQITAEMSYGSSYSVRVQKIEGAVDGTGKPIDNVFVALIKDMNDKPGVSGTFTTQMLTVYASDGTVSLSEEMVVRRVSEGIYVSLRALNCYGVLRENAQKNEDGVYGAEAYQSAETQAKAWLVLCDLENHKVIRQSISPEIEFTVRSEPDIMKQSFEEWNEATDQKLDIEQLGITYYVSERTDGVSTLKFYCGKGFLRTPARYKVQMNVSYKYDDETEFTFSSGVLLRSQPVRTREQIQAMRANDEELTDKLQRFISYVENHCLFDELCAEYTTAYAHYKGYDETYGYDVETVERILQMAKLWRDNDHDAYYLEERKALKAAQIPTDYSQIDWKGAWWNALEDYHKVNHSFSGLVMRIGADIVTGGWSEALFLPMDAASGWKHYKNTTPVEDQTLYKEIEAGAAPIVIYSLIRWHKAVFRVGKYVSDVTGLTTAAKGVAKGGKWVLTKTGEIVTWTGGTIINGAGKIFKPYVEEAAQFSSEVYHLLPKSWTNEIDRSIKYVAEKAKSFSPAQLYRRLMGRGAAAEQEAARQKLMAMLRQLRRDPQGLEAEILTLASDVASLNGAKLVKELAKAQASGAGEQTLKKLVLDILHDPTAIEQLYKSTGVGAVKLKQLYNTILQSHVYETAQEATIALLRRENPHTLYRFRNVSAKAVKALESGKTVGHDLDVTIEALIDGEWRAIGQETAAKAYSQGFCKANNIAYRSVDEAIEIVGAYQQHVCQSLKDPEFYIHVERLISKGHLGEGWTATEMKCVQGTFEHKMIHLADEAQRSLDVLSKSGKMEAVKRELTKVMEEHNSGLLPDISKLSAEAQQYVKASKDLYEAFRTGVKAGEQLAGKDAALVMKGGTSAVTPRITNGVETLKLCTKSAANAGEVNSLLRSSFGQEGYGALVGDMTLTLKNISESLNNLNGV